MTGPGHRATAFFTAAVAYALSADHGWLAAIICAMSGTSPDWLELPYRTRLGGFGRVIPHRRITHWLTGWLAVAGLSWWWSAEWQYSALFGLACGALTHVLMDVQNPSGVPVLHPWRRHSLNWWGSGEREWTTTFVWAALCLSTANIVLR